MNSIDYEQPPDLPVEHFESIRSRLHSATGIVLGNDKRVMVASRLIPRLRHYGFKEFSDYVCYIASSQDKDEERMLLELLTTNETYFFREETHFDFLAQHIKEYLMLKKPIRVWSAACSTGDEPYSIAMLLSEILGPYAFEVVGSDISQQVLERARKGHYSLSHARNLPGKFLNKYCLRGVRSQLGTFRIKDELRNQVSFKLFNLVSDEVFDNQQFDIIFLRNVLIYFDKETCKRVIEKLCRSLRNGGILITSLTESLNYLDTSLEPLQPSIYMRP